MSYIGRFSMSEIIADVLKGLQDYPIIQALLSVASLLAMAFILVRKGERDRKTINGNGGSRESVPNFLLISPLSDVFGAIHDMAEDGRNANKFLEQIVEGQAEMNKELLYHKHLLEFIRNNQEMRGDPQPPPNPHHHRRGL